mmetsp:Transcript_16621/g.54552  ORF Transcript_16621/g.54552 Transcript_16621/m.54552 type:complete len:231 (+) Transcript_16621:933-1625(+)
MALRRWTRRVHRAPHRHRAPPVCKGRLQTSQVDGAPEPHDARPQCELPHARQRLRQNEREGWWWWWWCGAEACGALRPRLLRLRTRTRRPALRRPRPRPVAAALRRHVPQPVPAARAHLWMGGAGDGHEEVVEAGAGERPVAPHLLQHPDLGGGGGGRGEEGGGGGRGITSAGVRQRSWCRADHHVGGARRHLLGASSLGRVARGLCGGQARHRPSQDGGRDRRRHPPPP